MILKYPVRVALNPFASTIGYTLPYIVSGSIIVSIVLGLPTVGPLLLKALIAQDMFLAGTIVLLLGVMTVIGTLISDILLVWIDPRIRLEDTDGRVRPGPRSRDRSRDGPVAAAPSEERISVASQWQLMWWRFRKHALAMASAHRRHRLLPGRRSARTSSPTPTPTRPRRSARSCRRSAIYWFDDGRFRPYVYGRQGARDPKTFKRVYGPTPSQKIPIRFFARASSTGSSA